MTCQSCSCTTPHYDEISDFRGVRVLCPRCSADWWNFEYEGVGFDADAD
jgi:hypothetical protein